MTLYGLKSCDTCRKALKSLAGAGQDVTFVDVREAGIPASELDAITTTFGDAAINTRSQTWRDLDAAERDKPVRDLLAEHPVVMKRPVIRAGDMLYLGWTDAVRAALIPASG